MKRFTVTWRDDVADQLAELVVKHWSSPLAQRIADAADSIDRELSRHPERIGHALVENVRLIVVDPLAVEYAVYTGDREVKLLSYFRCPPRSS